MPEILKSIPGTRMKVKIFPSGTIKQTIDNPIKLYLSSDGHRLVELKVDGKKCVKRIDKLVYRIFIGKHKKSKPVLIHKDRDKHNCYPNNLMYVTKEQARNFKKRANIKSTKGNKKGKAVKATDTHTGKSTTYKSPKLASIALGLPASKVRATIRTTGKLGNYKLEYI